MQTGTGTATGTGMGTGTGTGTGTRRIPIGSGQRPAPARPAPSHFQSSLDTRELTIICPNSHSHSHRPTNPLALPATRHSDPQLVFSFSRSQAFFGSNLPSSPSFVARYRRPGFPDDEESSVTVPSDGRTTSDDGTRGGEETEDNDDWSEDGNEQHDLDARAISWDSDSGRPVREQLPRNAVQQQRKRPQPPRREVSSSEASTSQSDRVVYGNQTPVPQPPHAAAGHARLLEPIAAATERSPLLQRDVDGTAAFPRRGPATFSNGKTGGAGAALRRLSVISAEAWTEAIEENRGMSTFGQTLFNTINVLIGVGLLAEPLAFADAGWVCGTLLLLFCALITNYTAKMLARIMSEDRTLLTYSDVLIKAYGPNARSIIHFLFVVELSALSIALVVLFSDSMASLFPSHSSMSFKLLSFFIILPTTFLPLRFLSLTSLIGIASSMMLLVVLIADGSIKSDSPGSLSHPMHTDFGPRWSRFPLSFGLMMSGFAGHAVIPSLYRDMREPKHFDAMINAAYVIAFTVSMLMGTLGYLMFGNDVSDEVTRDMRHTAGYPPFLNKVAVWMIAINPVVKYALASTPLIATLEHLTGLRPPPPPTPPLTPHQIDSAIASEDSSSSLLLPDSHLLLPPPTPTSLTRARTLVAVRPLVMAAVVAGSIAIPNFGIVLSFLGSSSAFVICAIGPIGAYLILGQRKPLLKSSPRGTDPNAWQGLGRRERVLCWALLGISIVLAAVGTVWTCLPIHSKHR